MLPIKQLSIPSAGRQPMKLSRLLNTRSSSDCLSIPSAGRQPMKQHRYEAQLADGRSFNTLCGSSANEAPGCLALRICQRVGLSIPSAGRQPMKRSVVLDLLRQTPDFQYPLRVVSQ